MENINRAYSNINELFLKVREECSEWNKGKSLLHYGLCIASPTFDEHKQQFSAQITELANEFLKVNGSKYAMFSVSDWLYSDSSVTKLFVLDYNYNHLGQWLDEEFLISSNLEHDVRVDFIEFVLVQTTPTLF